MVDPATLLRKHVTLKCRSLDRIFLQGYVPKLQSVGQVCTFLRWQRGFHIPSSAAFGKIGTAYTEAIEAFGLKERVPVVHFKKGEVKEDVARPYIEAAARQGKSRVVLIGIAQEKASVWRSWKAKGQEKARHPHMEWGRQMAFINHFYFYIWDEDWGPGTGSCRPPSPRTMCVEAMSTNSPSDRSRSPTPTSLIDRQPGALGSKASSATTSTLVVPTRWSCSSIADSPNVLQHAGAPASSTKVWTPY